MAVQEQEQEWTALPSQYLLIFRLSLTNTEAETNPSNNLMLKHGIALQQEKHQSESRSENDGIFHQDLGSFSIVV